MNGEKPPPLEQEDLAAVGRCREAHARMRSELAKVIVGQHRVIEQVLIALLSRGHALLEGVPGLAKTLLLSSLAEAAGLSFKRIQLTPDLTPSDVMGTEIVREGFETGRRHYEFLSGPVFANMVLADQIQLAAPKTQAVVLEAMEERQVSAGGTIHRLPDPFFVLATQNPLEEEGTHPLAAAQLDRFLLYIKIDYPTDAEESEIARRISWSTSGRQGRIEPVISAEELVAMQELVERAAVSDEVLGYACALVRASRPGKKEAAAFVDRWVQWGAGPRGVLALVTAAKARAILCGRPDATIGDVQAMAKPCLRHRMAGNPVAQANALSNDSLVEMLMEAVVADRTYEKQPE